MWFMGIQPKISDKKNREIVMWQHFLGISIYFNHQEWELIHETNWGQPSDPRIGSGIHPTSKRDMA
jgi:hypothetical protein